jgi:hypothetical protein
MTTLFHRAARFACVLCAAAVLIGCEAKLSPENFARIKNGMTLAEVQTILGSSGAEDSAPSGMTITGGGVAGSSRESKEKIYVWKEDGVTITVVLVDGKVVEARQTGL